MRLSTSTIYSMSMQSILRQQGQVADIGQQLASGKKVVTPADDPRAASQALGVSQSFAINEQFTASRSTARRNLSAEENELNTVVNALNAAKPLLVRAGNGTLNDADLNSVATELEGVYDQLLGSANAQDGNGRYIFAGFDSDTRPFVEEAGGVSYKGDDNRRELQVDASRRMPINDSGTTVFSSVTDSARYVGTAGANAGTAVMTDISVADSAAADFGDTFELTFGASGGDKTYTVMDTAGNELAKDVPYKAGEAIALGDSMSVTLEGEPAAGDSFVLGRDRSEDNNILETIKGVVDQLKAGTDTPQQAAALQNTVNSAHRKLDNSLDNVLTVRASLGSRLGELDTLDTVGENRSINYETTRSQLEDVDPVKAISDYSLAQVALKFAQQTFVDTQKLSMFNLV